MPGLIRFIAVLAGVALCIGCIAFVVMPFGGRGGAITPPAAAPPAAPAAPAKSFLRPGDQGRAQVDGAAGPFLANTPDDYDAFVKAAAAKDTAGVAQMVGQGRLAQIPNGTLVQVIDFTGVLDTKYRVRVLEGAQAGRAGWVPTEFIR